ncbi:MAG: hypothetical protein K0R34_326 [Herbinix sp.]|nr:hypothetical protein [Herbinix sp.]
MNTGIVEVDIHGMTRFQAKVFLDHQLKSAKKDIYRIRVIHGYQGGTQLRDMVRGDYRGHPKVLRVEIGLNQGSTDLILREL